MQDKHFKEIYRTLNGCIYQDNQRSQLVLEWYGVRSVLKIPCYFSLKKLVNGIVLEVLLSSPERFCDVEVINPCGCDRCFVLTIPQIIEFKDLVNGTKTMMELNSILHERLRRSFACI